MNSIRERTVIIFLVPFENVALNFKNTGPIFSSFNPFPFAIGGNGRQETVSVPQDSLK